MSEYWKSNAKKFCGICKVWFADNKISIENHERGLKHKGMVQARLREISKKANETERANEKLASILMQMEQAAVMSMSNSGKSTTTGASSGSSSRAAVMPKIERRNEYEEAKAKVRAEKDKVKQLKRTAKKSTLWNDDEEPQAQISTDNAEESGIQWVEASTEDGRKYYFNAYTGDTRWDAPKNFYTMEQYQLYYSQMVASTDLAGTSYDAYMDPSVSQQFYTTEPPPPEPEENVPTAVPKKLSSSPKHKKSRWYTEDVEEDNAVTDEDIKPEPVALYKQEVEESVESYSSAPTSSAGGLLGPWVPVERKEEVVVKHEVQPSVLLDDLPEEASQVKNVQPSFDELEQAELTFEERKAPIISTGKKSKVVEFKKRKVVNRNIRTREEF